MQLRDNKRKFVNGRKMGHWQLLKFIPLILASFLICHCAIEEGPICIKGGQRFCKTEGIFGSKWYNYYERGLSCSEGGCFDEALMDYRKAIKIREKDQRRAQTYGTIFIDYFPHRESGIIHYQKCDFENAKRELETSLSHYPSAKARFYLTRVLKILEKQKKAPKLTFNFDENKISNKNGEIWTKHNSVLISGDADDNNYIAEINIGKYPVFFGAEKHFHFEKTLNLPQGKNIIEVRAKNLIGEITKEDISVWVDRMGPSITIEELICINNNVNKEVKIIGTVYDQAGISEIRINDQEVSTENNEIKYLNEKFVYTTDGLTLVAYDKLGNKSSIHIPPSYYSNSQSPVVRIAAANLTQTSAYIGPIETVPLKIRRRENCIDELTVYQDEVYMRVEIKSGCKIKKVCISNGDKCIEERFRMAKIIKFDKALKLKEGKNIITIEASDKCDSHDTYEIIIHRKVPAAYKIGKRLSLNVSSFTSDEKNAYANKFQIKLHETLKKLNRFRVAREKDAQIQISGYVDQTSDGIEFVAEIYDLEDSKSFDNANIDAYAQSIDDLNTIQELARGMSLLILQEFPLLAGKVYNLKGDHILTDVIHRKLEDRKLLIYHEKTIWDDDSVLKGEIITDHQIIGRAKITELLFDTKNSVAKILNYEPDEIKTEDNFQIKVITE